MHTENTFNKALAMSFLVHIFLLLPLSILKIQPNQNNPNKIEVTYFKVEQLNTILNTKTIPVKDLDKIGLRERVILSREDRLPLKNIQIEQLKQDALLNRAKAALQKPTLPKTQLLSRNDIKLSLSETSKSQNPVYLNYQNFIRETLRRYLYNKYSNIPERGEVYLTFILNSDGAVKEAQVIDAKSNGSTELKGIVLDSLYGVSPFPPLPETLNTPILSFSVTVHFKERDKEE